MTAFRPTSAIASRCETTAEDDLFAHMRGSASRLPERCAALLVTAAAWVAPERLGRSGLWMAAGLTLALLALAGWRAAGRLLGASAALDRAVVAVVVSTSGLVLAATVLGQCGLLARGAFGSAVAALAFAASFLPANERAVTAKPRPAAGERPLALLAGLALAWLAFGLAFALHGARSRPPGITAFDDLSYHLPAAATWWQSGDLRMLKFPMGDPATAFYPIAGELVSWALLALGGGSDFLARFSELPFALALLVAVAALARRLELDARLAAVAVALVGGLPRIYPHLMLSAGNDVASAFFALALAHAAFLLAERWTRGRALAAGLALGLLLGTKYAGLLLLPIVGLPLAVVFVSQGWRARREVASALAWLLLAAALVGGYAYLRNTVTTGNPLYPAEVRLFGLELLPGRGEATPAAWKARPEYPIDVGRFLLANEEQLGPLFPWLLLPSAILAPLVALFWRRPSHWITAAFLAFPVGSWAIFLALFFDHRDVRYLLAGLAGTALAAVWLVDAIPGRAGALARLAVASAALVALARGLPLAPTVWPWMVGLAGLVVFAPGWREPAGRWRARAARVATVAPLLAATLAGLACADLAADYERTRLDGDGAARTVEALTRKRATTLAYVGWNQPYLFYGNGLRHRVRMLPTHREPGAELYLWGGSLAMPHDMLDRDAWLENLVAAGVELVVVVRGPDEHPERDWIGELAERFTPLWNDGRTEIWRLVPAPG